MVIGAELGAAVVGAMVRNEVGISLATATGDRLGPKVRAADGLLVGSLLVGAAVGRNVDGAAVGADVTNPKSVQLLLLLEQTLRPLQVSQYGRPGKLPPQLYASVAME